MNLKITTSVPLSIGGSGVQNLYGTLSQHAYDNAETGGLTVPCDLSWWLNATASEENKDKVWPTKADNSKLSSITVELTAEETAAPGLPYTIYTNVAEAITAANPGFTVTVEM